MSKNEYVIWTPEELMEQRPDIAEKLNPAPFVGDKNWPNVVQPNWPKHLKNGVIRLKAVDRTFLVGETGFDSALVKEYTGQSKLEIALYRKYQIDIGAYGFGLEVTPLKG